MTQNLSGPSGNPASTDVAASVPDLKPRRKLRLAAIGGIAAIAIVGGGITAVASASEPTSSAPSSSAPSSSANPSSGAPAAGATAAPTPPTPKPHLDGTVTKVSGTTVLIKDREGFTRTIVLSSTTTYSDGLKAALATGTKIHAQGTVDANGTSLDATAVGADKGPTGGPAGGPGEGGPRGPGGHGGRGGPGERPTPPAAGGATGTSPTAPSSSSAAPTTAAPTTS